MFFGPSFCWRPGAPRPKNHTCSEKYWLGGLAAEGGKAKQLSVPGNVWFLGLGIPGH